MAGRKYFLHDPIHTNGGIEVEMKDFMPYFVIPEDMIVYIDAYEDPRDFTIWVYCKYASGRKKKLQFDPEYDAPVSDASKRTKRLKCSYCGCISEKDYGTCEHCGAVLTDDDPFAREIIAQSPESAADNANAAASVSIADGAVTTTKLASNAVTTAKIDDGAFGTAEKIRKEWW